MRHFEAEIDEIKPKILLSFGEITHQLLIEQFGIQRPFQVAAGSIK